MRRRVYAFVLLCSAVLGFVSFGRALFAPTLPRPTSRRPDAVDLKPDIAVRVPGEWPDLAPIGWAGGLTSEFPTGYVRPTKLKTPVAGPVGYFCATALTAALLMRISRVRYSSTSFPLAATSLSFGGFEGLAEEAEPEPQSFIEQSKRGSKRGSKRAWEMNWDQRRSRVGVADRPFDESFKFDQAVNFRDADEEQSDPRKELESRGFTVSPLELKDEADDSANPDTGADVSPLDFQDEADDSANPDTGADDSDFDLRRAFPPSSFDPTPPVRGPLQREKELDPQLLEFTYQASGAQRFKNVRTPLRAFAMIFELEVLAPYTELYCTLWNDVAKQYNLRPVTDDEVNRAMADLGVDATIREFQWTYDRAAAQGALTEFKARLKSAVQDKTRLATFAEVTVGTRRWLDILKEEEIQAAIVSRHSRDVLTDLAEAAGLTGFTIVSAEDNFDSLEQAFLSAAAKLEMAPSACCTFGASPKSVFAAHEASMKGVSISGVHPRYELTVSDMIIDSFEDFNFDTVRAVMSTNELPELQLEPLPEPERDRYSPRF